MPRLQRDGLDRSHGIRNGASESLRLCKLRRGEVHRVCLRLRHRSVRDVEIQHQRSPTILPERHALSGAVLMKVSYKWLKEFVEVRETPQQLGTRFTNLGLAVEALE